MSSEEELDDFDVNDYDLAAAMGQEKFDILWLIGWQHFEKKLWNYDNKLEKVKRKKRTKKSQIYGIWNDEDSGDERPSFGQKKKKDYTAPGMTHTKWLILNWVTFLRKFIVFIYSF